MVLKTADSLGEALSLPPPFPSLRDREWTGAVVCANTGAQGFCSDAPADLLSDIIDNQHFNKAGGCREPITQASDAALAAASASAAEPPGNGLWAHQGGACGYFILLVCSLSAEHLGAGGRLEQHLCQPGSPHSLVSRTAAVVEQKTCCSRETREGSANFRGEGVVEGLIGEQKRVQRDILSRIAFDTHEVNGRVYRNVYENLGFKGPVPIMHKVGIGRIRMRCMMGGYSRGVFRFTRLARMGMMQLAREGWLKRYGYRPHLFR
ncbi:ribosomal protein s14 [Cyclospora cayetanensis]|uniref:Ribosomal protein s14 n=1 Tax=Cyclospora cayetanensis TaxID=88456 RepID=A0A1D3CT42_9EIME|nr:ribosomal protein s14 [Cyclospora cayetanensis]